MIVLDASAVLELLLGTGRGRKIATRIGDPGVSLHVPHLLDLEVANALRRYAHAREISPDEAEAALDALAQLDLVRHPHVELLDRVWELRDALSAYDAAYVALAEGLDARVLTCDARLSRAPGLSRRIEVV